MNALTSRLPALSYLLLAAHLVVLAARSPSETTLALVASSVVMFACCWASAAHLLGPRAAARFVAVAVLFGWFAEQMGASRGWFFGDYDYTDVLGPRIGDVPAMIPLMWFALSYTGYVTSNLIVSRMPVDGPLPLADAAALSFLAAMVVTAYDLGADPYMVFKLKAWIMARTDGWWFGETVQGFAGWMFVSFVIVMGFRLLQRLRPTPPPAAPVRRWHVAVPLAVYGGSMVFQMVNGYPVETRSIAAFAMGIPLVCALLGWRHWQPSQRPSASSGAAP
jgi:uncharacterized membrane protein